MKRFRPRRKPSKLTPLTVQLYLAGSSPMEVARAERVSPSHVTKVMLNQTVSWRVRKRIARILGKKVEELWAA